MEFGALTMILFTPLDNTYLSRSHWTSRDLDFQKAWIDRFQTPKQSPKLERSEQAFKLVQPVVPSQGRLKLWTSDLRAFFLNLNPAGL